MLPNKIFNPRSHWAIKIAIATSHVGKLLKDEKHKGKIAIAQWEQTLGNSKLLW